ncbi:MAG: hypothetical protein R2787_02465 [Saprospiraceae bacterium]
MTAAEALHALSPENDLEAALVNTPVFLRGLAWGQPRPGHPEGAVLYHIQEVLANLDAQELPTAQREELRLVALTHDTFKVEEDRLSRMHQRIHHGQLSASFLADWPVSDQVRQIVRWHDEAYYSWRMVQMGMPHEGLHRIQTLFQRLSPWWSGFLAFFRADTLTGDKDPAPLAWLDDLMPLVIDRSQAALIQE